MNTQEYISLLEAFRLSLTAENDPNVVQIVDQINETIANLKNREISRCRFNIAII